MTLQSLGNPFVRALLRSRLHGLLSGSLLLVTYTGRKTGRTFAIRARARPRPSGFSVG